MLYLKYHGANIYIYYTGIKFSMLSRIISRKQYFIENYSTRKIDSRGKEKVAMRTPGESMTNFLTTSRQENFLARET